MTKILRFLSLFCALMFVSNVAYSADTYTCSGTKKYTLCNPGYYMTKNGVYNGTPVAGNKCTACPTGYSCAGGTADKVSLAKSCAAGTYWDGSSCATCTGGYYCPGFTNVLYPTNGQGRTACPDATLNKRNSGLSAAPFYNAVFRSASINTAKTGLSAITSCEALSWYDPGERAGLFEYAKYNSVTKKYDNTSLWRYMSVAPGYFLHTKPDTGGCGQYAYYTEVEECTPGYYCPGKSEVWCNASNQSTVHTETFGREACPSLSTSQTSAGAYVSTWVDAKSSSSGATSADSCLAYELPVNSLLGTGTRRCYWDTSASTYSKTCHYYKYTSCNAGYQMTKDGVYNGTAQYNNNCTKCVAGTYKSSAGTGSCSVCSSANTYSDEGASSCLNCMTNYGYTNSAGGTAASHAGRASCTKNVTLDSNNGPYSTGRLQTCQEGELCYFGSVGSTQTGYTFTGGWGTTSSCTSTTTTFTTPTASRYYACKRPVTLTCASGEYMSGSTGTCESCTAGHYCVGGTFTYNGEDQGIEPCAAGQYQTLTGKSSCSVCAAGTSSGSGADRCIVCPSNTWSESGASRCEDCSSGFGNSGMAVSSHAKESSCKKDVMLNTNNGANATDYNKTCSQGEPCTFDSISLSDITQAGYVFTGWGTTRDCKSTDTVFTNPTEVQYYACKEYATYSCPAGQYLRASDATCQPCKAGNYCEGGTFTYNGLDQGMKSCDAGSYSTVGQSSCALCPAGSYSSNSGASSCTVCGKDTWSNIGATSCTACATQNGYGNDGSTAEDHAGQGSCTVTCDPGKYAVLGNACTTCPAGRYCTGLTVSELSTTVVPPKIAAGYYSSGGAYSPTPTAPGNGCLSGYSCGYVSAGYYSSSGGTSATPTAAGNGCLTGESCGPCTDGTYSGAGAASCSACSALGTVAVTGGTYSSVSPRNANTTCRYVAPTPTKPAYCATKTSNTISYSGSAWGTNIYSVTANSGSIIVDNNTKDATCTQCAAGTSSAGGTNTSCGPCADGTYSGAGAASCSACSALGTVAVTGGTYSSVSPRNANTTCRYVAPTPTKPTYCATKTSNTISYSGSAWGTNIYSVTANSGSIIVDNNTKDATCTQCAAGTSSAGGTNTSCGPCADGTYSGAGAGSCSACSALNSAYTKSDGSRNAASTCYLMTDSGKFVQTANAAQVTCIAGGYCPGSVKVSYGSTGGRTECAAGTHNASTGASAVSACTACVIGSYSGTGASSCTACQSGKTTSAAGQTSCNANCSNATNVGAWKTATWKTDNSGVTNLCTIDGASANACAAAVVGTGAKTATFSVTGNACVYSGTCNVGYATPTASGKTVNCTKCTAGTYQGTAGSTAASCTAASKGHYVPSDGASSQTECAAGKYQDATGQSSCKSCPTLTSGGYAYTTTTGLIAVTECTETKSYSDVNQYCYSGALTKTAKDANTWNPATSTLTAKAGAILTGSGDNATCSQCSGSVYSAGGSATSCTGCPNQSTGWQRQSGTGWSAVTQCYETQTPANCASGTVKHHATTAGVWDTGTPTLVTALTSNAGYYANSTATSCTICPAGSYCPAGATAATSCVLGSYSGSGASSCTACQSGKTTSAAGQTSCNANCSNATNVGAWKTSTWKTDNSGVTNLCTIDQCKNATFLNSNACAACPTAESGWAQGTGTGWTLITQCYETTTPAVANSPIANICTAGTLTKNATNTGTWGTASASGLTAKAGRYVNGTTCTACATGTYTSAASTATACTPASKGYYVNGTEQIAQTACAAGTYTSSTGQSSCTDAIAGTYTTGCGTNNTACTGTSVCAADTYSDAKASSCSNCTTAKGYHTSGTAAANHAGLESCKVTCAGGSYVATAGAGCVNVGAGYWGVGGTANEKNGTIVRTQCTGNLTTIGYGAGADEAADCGRILHAGDRQIYLRSVKKTTPSLNVKVDGTTYYGNMTAGALDGYLIIKDGNVTYRVHDDSK